MMFLFFRLISRAIKFKGTRVGNLATNHLSAALLTTPKLHMLFPPPIWPSSVVYLGTLALMLWLLRRTRFVPMLGCMVVALSRVVVQGQHRMCSGEQGEFLAWHLLPSMPCPLPCLASELCRGLCSYKLGLL